LLYILREKLGLTGAKPGCLNGACGACTVDVDGDAMKSCLMLSVEADNKQITTIEGLHKAPIQKQFITGFASHRDYRTPGFVVTCQTLINEQPDATDNDIKERLESNTCRCTGYKEIEEAIKTVLSETRQAK